MQYWILKTEPDVFSFEDLINKKTACWDGVRNYQARKNLRLMELGDIAIIYHSNIGKEAVGIAKVVKKAYQDPTTKQDWSAVDVVPIEKLKKPVSLEQMKKDKILKNISLVRQSRLSVSPISKNDFERIKTLSKI
ncbi:MAG: EVE domain-containing protein [Oligoflexia bacterium]|nr:EVE domain-containing protein [Oligoflexia bacterium]